MPEIVRNRDVVVFDKGDCFTVAVDELMAVGGWQGGSGVKYTTSVADNPTVTYSDGEACAFLLWGSNEVPDDFTSMTRNQPTYRFAVIGAGGWTIATRAFEQYTYASRQMGPLVPIAYHASDRLRFSLRGLWTNEDEWTLSGDPRAPNTQYTGFVVQRPTPARNNYMTIQIGL